MNVLGEKKGLFRGFSQPPYLRKIINKKLNTPKARH